MADAPAPTPDPTPAPPPADAPAPTPPAPPKQLTDYAQDVEDAQAKHSAARDKAAKSATQAQSDSNDERDAELALDHARNDLIAATNAAT